VTQVADPVVRPSHPSAPRDPGMGRAGRWPVVIAMILALVCCGLCGSWATDWKIDHGRQRPVAAQHGALGSMNSYSLALMLGGLRGPLVMVLWSKVENQKVDRDLEDVDTMIEWIRLLQPEFDTVHIFQIWNKAYNISALMVSTASKYMAILDAVDYARRVDAEKPGDVNILDQLARVFGEKLGGPNVQERLFYTKQFREDTLTDANRRKAYPQDDATYRRMGFKFFGPRNAPILTENNDIDPQLLAEHTPRPADARGEWNTGAELQYLAKYQPFPMGLPAPAMGYNYAKRAQVSMTVGGQKPLQLSDTVIDSYPAILLRQWAQAEQDRAAGYEGEAFGLGGEDKPINGISTAVASPLDAPVDNRQMLDWAIYCYRTAAQVAADSLAEYHRHLASPQYVNPFMSYTGTLQDLEAQRALTSGDYAYLSCFQPGANQGSLREQAARDYREARTRYEKIVLSSFVETPLRAKLFARGDVDVNKLSDARVDELSNAYLAAVSALPREAREFDDDRRTYGMYITRASIRGQQLEAAAPGAFLRTP
jgi:hypothetical protein